VFTEKFGRDLAEGATLGGRLDLWQRFEVERYLDHHGSKLITRFDANSYLIIGKAMDLHDVGRGRSGVVAAMARITMPSLVVGISSDMLYPIYQQRQIHGLLDGITDSRFFELDSPHGHDAFLINLDQIGPPIEQLLADVAKG
jgi:homoserine O-acetyltransferase